jgi:hypothetical protein
MSGSSYINMYKVIALTRHSMTLQSCCDDLWKEELNKIQNSIHPNKKRSQSKINGKNSRWC